tara:strand:- start:139 stop:714 length:576 start_codon:yes stop_codon:yes gene_type:complete
VKKFLIYIFFFLFFFGIKGNSNESAPYKDNLRDIFNIGQMLSHDKEFTLFFKTRDRAVLAKGEGYNYITDYPQDLYLFHNNTKKTKPLITYDWFPKKAKALIMNYEFPVFPEDYAYYLLNDNQTLIMISAIKAINNNFKYNIVSRTLEVLPENNRYNFVISSILKGCGFKNMSSLYECKYYKPLISINLIN